MKKMVLKSMIFCFLLCFLFPQEVEAKTIQVVNPTNVVSDGTNIYYDVTVDALKSYNIKTGKKKIVAKNTRYNGEMSVGYHSLTMVGDYIYCINNKLSGTGRRLEYLYRIHKKTGKIENFDSSDSYVIKGDWIYYVKNKIISSEDYITIGFYKMKLDGSEKTKITSLPTGYVQLIGMNQDDFYFRSLKNQNYSYYQYDMKQDKMQRYYKKFILYDKVGFEESESGTVGVKQGEFSYYIKNGKLCRKDQEEGVYIYPFSDVNKFTVLKNEIVVKSNVPYYEENGKQYSVHLYCIKKNGKDKKLIDRWFEP